MWGGGETPGALAQGYLSSIEGTIRPVATPILCTLPSLPSPPRLEDLMTIFSFCFDFGRGANEETGLYSLHLALALHRVGGIEVMVANPRVIADFAKVLLQRSTTDKLDTEVMLEFSRRMPKLLLPLSN